MTTLTTTSTTTTVIYTVPSSIDQQITDLEAEEIRSAMLAASGYFDLWIESQAKITLLNNALNNLN